jgi:hypothetical protein
MRDANIPANTSAKTPIEILYFEGCPNHESTVDRVREVLRELELELEVEVREVAIETADEAERHRFIGSPSVRVNGLDVEREARGRRDFGLGCRLYHGGGIPPKELLTEALRSVTGELEPPAEGEQA